jgi:hypothetical protein
MHAGHKNGREWHSPTHARRLTPICVSHTYLLCALPWSSCIVDKRYLRNPDPRPMWLEYYCGGNTAQIVIGRQNYFLGADGFLMPAGKDQAPPDLRYFHQTQK